MAPPGGEVAGGCGLADDPGDDVVVVGFGDFAVVEASWLELVDGAEVVDVDFAVDLGGVELGAAFPEERRLFGFVFD